MKKAQLQAMETIIISIILVLLVLIGLWFYSGVSASSADQTSRLLSQEDANTLVILLSELPELSCPDRSVETRNCLDITKIDLLSQAITNPESDLYTNNNRLYYASLFGATNITITQRYPEPSANTASYQLFDGATTSNVLTRTLPINLYDPRTTPATTMLAEIEVVIAR